MTLPWNSSMQSNGHSFSLWLAGHATYGACIFIANLIVFHRHYEHNYIGFGLFGLMIFAFFFFTIVQSEWSDPTTFADLSHLAGPFMSSTLIWLTIFLSCVGVSAFELYLRFEQNLQEQKDRDTYDKLSQKQKDIDNQFKSS